MTWIYSVSFLPFTISAVTSEKAGYEAAKLPIYDEHSYVRSWRSDDQVTEQTIRCTFASAQTLAGIGLFHLNGPVLQLKKSTNNGSSYTDLITGSGSFSDYTAQKHLAYYRYSRPLSGATGVTDVQIVVKAQTPIDGAAYLELGSVVFAGSLTSFPRPPRRGMVETLMRMYDDSGLTKRQAGPWRSEMEWQLLLRDQTQLDAWRAIALQGEDALFLVAKENAETPQAYLMRYDSPLQFEDHKTYGRVNARWIEMA
jgi:hypothetical protein